MGQCRWLGASSRRTARSPLVKQVGIRVNWCTGKSAAHKGRASFEGRGERHMAAPPPKKDRSRTLGTTFWASFGLLAVISLYDVR